MQCSYFSLWCTPFYRNCISPLYEETKLGGLVLAAVLIQGCMLVLVRTKADLYSFMQCYFVNLIQSFDMPRQFVWLQVSQSEHKIASWLDLTFLPHSCTYSLNLGLLLYRHLLTIVPSEKN